MSLGYAQKLTCTSQAGYPTAKLSWFRGSAMMESHYSVEGDVVKAEVISVSGILIFFLLMRNKQPKIWGWLMTNLPNGWVLPTSKFFSKSWFTLVNKPSGTIRLIKVA